MSGEGCQEQPYNFLGFFCAEREEQLLKRPRVNGHHIFHVWLRLPTHGIHPAEPLTELRAVLKPASIWLAEALGRHRAAPSVRGLGVCLDKSSPTCSFAPVGSSDRTEFHRIQPHSRNPSPPSFARLGLEQNYFFHTSACTSIREAQAE